MIPTFLSAASATERIGRLSILHIILLTPLKASIILLQRNIWEGKIDRDYIISNYWQPVSFALDIHLPYMLTNGCME